MAMLVVVIPCMRPSIDSQFATSIDDACVSTMGSCSFSFSVGRAGPRRHSCNQTSHIIINYYVMHATALVARLRAARGFSHACAAPLSCHEAWQHQQQPWVLLSWATDSCGASGAQGWACTGARRTGRPNRSSVRPTQRHEAVPEATRLLPACARRALPSCTVVTCLSSTTQTFSGAKIAAPPQEAEPLRVTV